MQHKNSHNERDTEERRGNVAGRHAKGGVERERERERERDKKREKAGNKSKQQTGRTDQRPEHSDQRGAEFATLLRVSFLYISILTGSIHSQIARSLNLTF